MTSKIFFDTKDELEGIFSGSGSELGSEKDWFGEFKHLLFIIFLIFFFVHYATTWIEKPLIFAIAVAFIQVSFVFYCFCSVY